MNYLNTLLAENHYLAIISAAVLGLFVNLAISLGGQTWARLSSQRYSAFLLPPAGLIITWTISSNLALSLGMIGALSIVRFRTPIKNPFELVIFFCYLIIGISVGVSPQYGISLAILAAVTPSTMNILDFFLNLIGGKASSKMEFSESPVQLLLQIISSKFEIPSEIPMDKISSVSSHIDEDKQDETIDIIIQFKTMEEALTCLKIIKSENRVLQSSIQVLGH